MRLLVVEDEPKLGKLLVRGLGEEGHAADLAVTGDEALWMATAAPYDVIVLDVSMPGGSGIHAVPELLERAPKSHVLMLSVHEDAEYVLESVRAGAHGYLRKDSTPAELRTAIAAVHAGDGYYSPQLAAVLANALRTTPTPAPAAQPPRATDVLTAREIEILTHVAEGMTNREIGTALGISTRTVEAHRDSLMRKLGIRTVAGLTKLAIEQGLIGSN